MSQKPAVYIVGRPNVGKSTLFNRFVGKTVALVDDQPGSTRDIREAEVLWNGRAFALFDSGGWIPGEKNAIAGQIAQQLDEQASRASILLCVMDARSGVSAADEILLRHLRKFDVPLVLAVNKTDQYERFDEGIADFRSLGIDPVFPVSAIHGIGVDDLLDALVSKLPLSVPDLPEEGTRPIRVALLGKPNVGKSSLVNALIGQNRLLVDDAPGTTHDAIAVGIEFEGNPLVLVDTAGLRAHKKQDTRIEHLSIQQSMNALQTCQVALFLVDGEKGITHQDVAIGHMIEEAFRPVILLINKWDVHPKGMEQAWAEKITKRHLRCLKFAPVLVISAKTGLNLDRIFPEVLALWKESLQVIPTARLNDVLRSAVSHNPPTAKKDRFLRILYAYQRKGHPPAIEMIANHPESTRISYIRYLEEEIRKAFDMTRTPLQVVMKLKKQAHKKNPKKQIVRRK